MWAERLRSKVSKVRGRFNFKDREEELAAIGFDFDRQPILSSKDIGWDKIKLAFDTYKSTEIPCKFEVPRKRKWDEDLWDLKLGITLQNIRSRGSYKKNHDELRAMGCRF